MIYEDRDCLYNILIEMTQQAVNREAERCRREIGFTSGKGNMSATLQFTIAVARVSALGCGFATVRHSLNLERAQKRTTVIIADGNGTSCYDSSLTLRSCVHSQVIRKDIQSITTGVSELTLLHRPSCSEKDSSPRHLRYFDDVDIPRFPIRLPFVHIPPMGLTRSWRNKWHEATVNGWTKP